MFLDEFKIRLKTILSESWGRRIFQYIEACKYLDWRVWDHEWGNTQLYKSIIYKEPQAIFKLGAVELAAIRRYLRYSNDVDAMSKTALHRRALYVNAGVFPDDYSIYKKYVQLMIEHVLPKATIIGVWFNWGEASIIKRYCPNAIPIRLGSFSAYLWKHPWTQGLANLRVLVVSPFAKSIMMQYSRRREVWSAKPGLLPDFELDILIAPLSAALVPPEHANWFDALQALKDAMAKKNFDVALIGAGAYSAPLAVHAKELGRIGIHLGGETQFLFGIKGRRWDDHPMYNRFYNQYWVRPLPEETPSSKYLVEDGCYW